MLRATAFMGHPFDVIELPTEAVRHWRITAGTVYSPRYMRSSG